MDMRSLAAASFAFGLMLSASAFTHSSVMTTSGYTGSSTLTNFPVLVKIDSTHVPGFDYSLCRDDGRDISFTSSDGTDKYVFEVDTWNTSGTSLVWVKIPELTAATAFRFCFGDKVKYAPPRGNATNVWCDAMSAPGVANFYVGVWHMNESAPTGSEVSPDAAKHGSVDLDAYPDDTYYDGGGDLSQMTSTNGCIGGARNVSANGTTRKQSFRVQAFDAYGYGSTLTLSAWVKANANAGGPIFGGGTRWNNTHWGRFGVEASSATAISCAGGSGKGLTGTIPNIFSDWVHLAFVCNGTKGAVYANGASVASGTINSINLGNGWLTKPDIFHLGGYVGNGAFGRSGFAGRLDEVRILKGAASADWVKAEYDTVASDAFISAATAVAQEIVDPDWQSTAYTFPVGFYATSPEAAFTVDGASVAQGVVQLTAGDHTVAVTGGGNFLGWAGALAGVSSSAATLTVGEEGTFVAAVTDGASSGAVSWSATESGEWYDAANWTPKRVPGAGDTVTLPDGASVRIDALTPSLASLTVAAGAELVARNWQTKINAAAVTIGGTVKTEGAFWDDEMSNRVWLAGTTLTVSAGGRISADAAGYAGRNGPAWVGATRRSASNTSQGLGTSRYGGAYGGEQGWDWRKCSSMFSGWTAPSAYGSAEWPYDPGSGAGAYYAAGGGAIYLDFSGAVTIDGAVTADSNRRNTQWDQYWSNASGNGSGGGVLIVCGSIAGSGSVSASGSTSRTLDDSADSNGSTSVSSQNGGDGGGRIAVHYDATAQKSADCRIAFAARPGVSMGAAQKVRPSFVGGLGSLWFTDDQFLTSDAYLADGWKFAGVWQSGATPSKLTVAGSMTCADGPKFPSGYSLEVQGDLTVTGTVSWAGGFGLTDGELTVGGNLTLRGAKLDLEGGTLAVGGNFVQDCLASDDPRTAGEFVAQAAATNGTEEVTGFSADIRGTWWLKTGAVCYPWCHATDGAIPTFRVRKLQMDSGSSIDADQKGYESGYGPSSARSGASAAHGSAGGYFNQAGKEFAASTPYDSRTAPCMPGVSKGSYNRGGGVVSVYAYGDMTIEGVVSANANSSGLDQSGYSAGSSGGAVNLSARKFTMDGGSIRSRGSPPKTPSSEVQGAGGRIAVAYRKLMTDGLWDPSTEEYDTTKIDVTALPWNASWSGSSDPGTVWFGTRMPFGMVLLVR